MVLSASGASSVDDLDTTVRRFVQKIKRQISKYFLWQRHSRSLGSSSFLSKYAHVSGQAFAQTHSRKNTRKHHKREEISACLSCVEAEMSSDKEPRSPLFVYVSITATWQQSDSSNKGRWLVGKKKNNNNQSKKSISSSWSFCLHQHLGPLFSFNFRPLRALKLFRGKKKKIRSHPRTQIPPHLHWSTGTENKICSTRGVCWKRSDLHVKTNTHRLPSFRRRLSIQRRKGIEKLCF